MTRAIAETEAGTTHEYVLVEARNDVSRVINSIERDKAFERRTITGLPMWLRPEFALARVGPRTLAIGGEKEVAALARVRLGISPDLNITAPLFDRFQSLKEWNAVLRFARTVNALQDVPCRFQPPTARRFHPVWPFLPLQSVKARSSSRKIGASANDLAARSPRTATLAQVGGFRASLLSQPPEIEVDGANVSCALISGEQRPLILQRLAKTSPTPTVVEN